MSTARRPGSTRERLLEVALDLFVAQGFEGTTITEVERGAGLTAGTGSFYRHFPSKEALLQAAVEREVERCLAEAAENRAAAEEPDEVGEVAMLLGDIRRFSRLFHLQLTEGDRVPELREAISTALAGAGEKVTWAESPDLVLRIIALTGYQVLSTMGEDAVRGVPEDEFVEALATLRLAR